MIYRRMKHTLDSPGLTSYKNEGGDDANATSSSFVVATAVSFSCFCCFRRFVVDVDAFAALVRTMRLDCSM